jgi:hypothetical protein
MVSEGKSKRRRARGLPILVTLLLLLLVFRGTLTREIELRVILASRVPNRDSIAQLAARVGDEADLLRIWSGGEILHRRAVMDALWELQPRERVVEFESVLREGAFCRDSIVREFALLNLYTVKHPEWRNVAHAQLSDPDIMVRHNAVEVLRHGMAGGLLHQLGHALEDSEPLVRERAAAAIVEITGILPYWQSYHRVDQRAFGFVKIWWEGVAHSHASEPLSATHRPRSQTRQLRSGVLEDFAGTRFAVGNTDGKPTLLFFFASRGQDSFPAISHMNALDALFGDRISIVGVALDALHNLREHLHMELNEHAVPESQTREAVIDQVKTMIDRLGIQIRVLLDVDGDVTAACDGGEAPVFAILSAEGDLLERVAGVRSQSALTTLLKYHFPDSYPEVPGLNIRE